MVVFTCNNCGDSVKKTKAEKHVSIECKKKHAGISLCCVDCLNDFRGNDYNDHVKCVTEEERYGGAGYVAKASSNKGERKQESWMEIVQNVMNKPNLSKEQKNLLKAITQLSNVPRKRAKFHNFLKNSCSMGRYNTTVADSVFNLIENEFKSQKNELNLQESDTTQNKSSGSNTNLNIVQDSICNIELGENKDVKEKKKSKKNKELNKKLEVNDKNAMEIDETNESVEEVPKEKKKRKNKDQEIEGDKNDAHETNKENEDKMNTQNVLHVVKEKQGDECVVVEKEIQLNEEINSPLKNKQPQETVGVGNDSIQENEGIKEKKKRKNKKREELTENVEIQVENIMETEETRKNKEEVSKKKKKRKNKNETNGDKNGINENDQENEGKNYTKKDTSTVNEKQVDESIMVEEGLELSKEISKNLSKILKSTKVKKSEEPIKKENETTCERNQNVETDKNGKNESMNLENMEVDKESSKEEGKNLSKKEKKERKRKLKYENELKSIETDQKPTEEEIVAEEEPTRKKKKNKRKTEDNTEQPKVKKTKNGEIDPIVNSLGDRPEETTKGGKFKWFDNIKKILEKSPDNEISVKKLSKKIINEYLSVCPDHHTKEEISAKLNKKLNNCSFANVFRDKVKLSTVS